MKGGAQNILQAFLNISGLPEIALHILYPLEVGHDHATGVGQDVWNDKDSLVLQHAIGLQRRRTVRPFGEDPTAQFRGIAFGDLLRERGRDQHGAVELQQFVVGEPISQLGITEGLAPGLVASEELRNVQTARIVDASLDIAHCNNACATLLHDASGMGPDVAEPLYGHGRVPNVELEVAKRFHGNTDHSTAGGLLTSEASSNGQGLACDDAWHRIPHLLTICVHDPGHYLSVCADVWGWYIFFWPDQREDFRRIAPGQSL